MHSYQQLYHSQVKYKLACMLFIISCLCFSPITLAQPAENKEESNFILHHIGDAHEWHLATIGHTHITIPLPVVLVSKDRGVEIFSSSRFLDSHHHRVSYRGYHVNSHEKVVADDPTWRFYDLSITKNVASMLMSMILLVTVALIAARRYKTNTYGTPRGFWGLLEMLICFVRDEIAIPNMELMTTSGSCPIC
jgi:F-type H+-transporting ATPase subunit a